MFILNQFSEIHLSWFLFSDYIRVVVTNPTDTPSVVSDAFNDAATRWSLILAGTNIETGSRSGTNFNQFGCDLTNNALLPLDVSGNELIIAADIDTIDGPMGILGTAGPCNDFRARVDDGGINPEVLLPGVGAMRFDIEDLQILIDRGTLQDVILHEMAHGMFCMTELLSFELSANRFL